MKWIEVIDQDMEKLLVNLNKKHKLDVLRNVYKKVYSVDVSIFISIDMEQPKLVANYRVTEAIARYCMLEHDEELFQIVLPNVEAIRSLTPYSHGNNSKGY